MSRIYILREKDKTTKSPDWKVIAVTLYKDEALEWVDRHGPRAKVHREFDTISLYIPDDMLDEWNC